MTIADFKKKLEEGGYENRTGALRGLGRSPSLTAAEKEKCRGLVDKHFGAESAPAAKTGPKKKTGTKKAAKRAASTPPPKVEAAAPPPKGKGRSKKVTKKATGKAPKAAKRSSDADPEPSQAEHPALAHTSLDTSFVQNNVNVLTGVVKGAREAIDALDFGRRLEPTLDVSSGVKSAGDAISTAMQSLCILSTNLVSLQRGEPIPAQVQSAPVVHIAANGASMPPPPPMAASPGGPPPPPAPYAATSQPANGNGHYTPPTPPAS